MLYANIANCTEEAYQLNFIVFLKDKNRLKCIALNGIIKHFSCQKKTFFFLLQDRHCSKSHAVTLNLVTSSSYVSPHKHTPHSRHGLSLLQLWISVTVHQPSSHFLESYNIPRWKEPTRITESNSRLGTDHPKPRRTSERGVQTPICTSFCNFDTLLGEQQQYEEARVNATSPDSNRSACPQHSPSSPAPVPPGCGSRRSPTAATREVTAVRRLGPSAVSGEKRAQLAARSEARFGKLRADPRRGAFGRLRAERCLCAAPTRSRPASPVPPPPRRRPGGERSPLCDGTALR